MPGRGRERMLLVFPALFLAAGMLQLTLASKERLGTEGMAAGLFLALALFGLHVILSARKSAADQVLVPIAAMLGALGLVTVARLEPALATRQGVWLTVGLALAASVSMFLPSVDVLRRYKYTSALAGIALVLLTTVFGVDPNGSGARLWLGVNGLLFQPSELLKVLLVIFFAAYLEENRELLQHSGPRFGPLRLPPIPYLAPLLFMLGVALAVLVLQRDLGAALLFFGLFLALLFAASGRWELVGLGVLLFLALAFVAYLAFDHIQLRISVWLDPWSQAQTGGYQLIQGMLALAAGGVLGTGVGLGAPGYVPAVHTDFIVAAVGEELGLAGALAMVLLYALLVQRAFRVALRTPNDFGALLAAGCGSAIALQSLIILGGTLRLIPLTGITLPLMSYGGSSVVANGLMLGLLLRISDEATRLRDAR